MRFPLELNYVPYSAKSPLIFITIILTWKNLSIFFYLKILFLWLKILALNRTGKFTENWLSHLYCPFYTKITYKSFQPIIASGQLTYLSILSVAGWQIKKFGSCGILSPTSNQKQAKRHSFMTSLDLWGSSEKLRFVQIYL